MTDSRFDRILFTVIMVCMIAMTCTIIYVSVFKHYD